MDTATLVNYEHQYPEIVAKSNEMLQEIMDKSAVDPAFRTQLLEQPREALQAFTGAELPADTSIVFVENKADATFVLPPYQDPALELSEEELEAVAGGEAIVASCLGIAASVLTIAATIGYIVND